MSDSTRIGARARELIAGSRAVVFSGRVLAVVSDAVYLATADGEIVWLSQPRVPMHRRAICGTYDLRAFRKGMYFHRNGEHLDFAISVRMLHSHDRVRRPAHFAYGLRGSLPSIHFGNACAWRPRPLRPNLVMPRESISARARGLHVDVAFEPLAPFVIRMQQACRAHDLLCVLEIGRDLIGLGPGLTPSGDDLLGGLLFAIYQLHSVYPTICEWNTPAVEDLLAWARPRTNAISHSILCDHALGQGAEPLHALLAALLEGTSAEEIERQTERVLAIGSTSGAEMLAGILTGMQVLE